MFEVTLHFWNRFCDWFSYFIHLHIVGLFFLIVVFTLEQGIFLNRYIS